MEDFKSFLQHQEDLGDFKVYIKIGNQEKYTNYDIKDYNSILKYFKSSPKWAFVFID